MLKWKNVRTVVLLASVILGLSSVFIYLSVNRPIARKGFHELLLPIEGEEVSLAKAQASATFKIGLPTSVGAPTEIKLDLPPHSIPERVYIIYAAHKPSGDATTRDVFDQNGIILFEMPNLVTVENASQCIGAAIESTKNDPGGGLQEVSINGYVGCAGGNVGHTVAWYTETTYYELSANINCPLQKLVDIARSIPVK